jgi:hypothetical protein
MQYEEQMAPLIAIPPLRSTQYADAVADALTLRRIIYEKTLHQLATTESVLIATAAEQLITTLTRCNKVLVIGNGGSAAEAQHFAAELIGRFKRERAICCFGAHQRQRRAHGAGKRLWVPKCLRASGVGLRQARRSVAGI